MFPIGAVSAQVYYTVYGGILVYGITTLAEEPDKYPIDLQV